MEQDFYLNFPCYTIPKSIVTDLFEKENPLSFHKSLSNYKPTPLHSLPGLAKKYGVAKLYLKDESHRFGLNAFKGLGTSYAIHRILEKQSNITTVCTATDGNHGRALAWSARLYCIKSVIFVTRHTTQESIEKIEKEGATVINTGKNYDETCQIAKDMSAKNAWALVQDTAWEGYEKIPAYIMTGYLSQFQEMEQQLGSLEKIDVVALQAGVGSWAAAGIWYFINKFRNKPRIVVVEPRESDGILASFKAGKRKKPDGTFETIMSGLNCGIPSLTAWDIIKNGADASLRIHDEYARIAMRELYFPTTNDPRIIAGESGAGGLAGFLYLKYEPKAQSLRRHLGISANSSILCINTEGATDSKTFKTIINQD